MPTLRDNLDDALEEIKEIPEEIEKTVTNVASATYDAAKRRLEDDWLGRVAVIVAFILIGFANMGISWLEGRGFLTPEGLILILGGIVLFVVYRLVVMVYNYFGLRLQEKAVLVDIEEAKAHRAQLENQNYLLQKGHERDRKQTLFKKQQNRLDQKLHQDLQLRQPFFEQAQQELMALFARDDIAAALQGASTFADTVARMDDTLLKRADVDVTFEKLAKGMSELTELYKDIHRQVLENAELLNQSITREAELIVRWKQNEVDIGALRVDFSSIKTSLDNIADIFKAIPTKEEPTIPKNVVATTYPGKTTSITSELDDLVEEHSSDSETSSEGGLPPPPS